MAARLASFFPTRRTRLPATVGGSVHVGQRGARSGRQILGKISAFRRGLIFSAFSYLGYEASQLISHCAVVHASIKVEELLDQADYLYESGETEKLYHLLAKYKQSEDAELLWRLARASRDLSQLSSTSAEEKKQLVYKALEYAKKALEKNPSSFAAHKWYAICISDVGDYEGIKAKIANAYVIKEHFEKAIELNPKDATSIHLMGVWCYSFAEMPWYQSRIAAMLFATPPSSTYEEALNYFQKAEQADPNFYSKNLLLLGKTYLKLNNKKLAAFWLLKAKDYPVHTEEDKQVQKEAADLLKTFSVKT
ncbi:regulator of microtubule dynamics protein 1 [Tachyglossus aculeatus]|uniref:regulator of microtubule dynamics protein 1 n=1 Tax=Tachyglossus aculeatus TaxID=9261 RepID=UPI0018F7A4D8|nr:regulator of microtubule dynamics protein 1 [Tachyglossus aculeatus]